MTAKHNDHMSGSNARSVFGPMCSRSLEMKTPKKKPNFGVTKSDVLQKSSVGA